MDSVTDGLQAQPPVEQPLQESESSSGVSEDVLDRLPKEPVSVYGARSTKGADDGSHGTAQGGNVEALLTENADDAHRADNVDQTTQAADTNVVAGENADNDGPPTNGGDEEEDDEPPIKRLRQRRTGHRGSFARPTLAEPAERLEEDEPPVRRSPRIRAGPATSEQAQVLNPGTKRPGIAMKKPRGSSAPRTPAEQAESQQLATPPIPEHGSKRLRRKKFGSGSNYFETVDTDSDDSVRHRPRWSMRTSGDGVPEGSEIVEACYAVRQGYSFDVRLTADKEVFHALLLDWTDTVRGFLAALRGNSSKPAAWVSVEDLEILTNYCIDKTESTGEGGRSIIEKVFLVSAAGETAMKFKASGRYSGGRFFINLLSLEFTLFFQEQEQVYDFAMFAVNAREGRPVPTHIHEKALEVMATFKAMKAQLTGRPGYGTRPCSVQQLSPLGTRVSHPSTVPPTNLQLDDTLMVPFSRWTDTYRRINCVVAAICNGMSVSHDEEAEHMYEKLKERLVGNFKEISAFMHSLYVKNMVPVDFGRWVLVNCLPTHIRDVQRLQKERLEWLLKRTRGVYIAALIDSDGSSSHVICIAPFDVRMVVYDSEESVVLPLTQLALDRCVGHGVTCDGIGEIRELERLAPKKLRERSKISHK